MKSAEETCRRLLNLATCADNTDDSFQNVFFDFVTAYADERVNEERQYWQQFMKLNKFEDQSEARNSARAEALEEAAKICDKRQEERYSADCALEAGYIADEIRALKDKQ